MANAKHQVVTTNYWVFALQCDTKGRILRFKARLVIHGFKRKYGVD